MQKAKTTRYFKYFRKTIFKYYRRSIQYSLPSDASNTPQYDDLGRLVSDNQSIDTVANWQTVYDPIFPTLDRSSSRLLEGLSIINNSTAQQSAYMWLSALDIPVKTMVKVDGKEYKVSELADYKNVFGFSIYYLRGRSDMDGLSDRKSVV